MTGTIVQFPGMAGDSLCRGWTDVWLPTLRCQASVPSFTPASSPATPNAQPPGLTFPPAIDSSAPNVGPRAGVLQNTTGEVTDDARCG